MFKRLLLLTGVLVNSLTDVLSFEPKLDTQFRKITIEAGRTAVLPCFVENIGSHKVVWKDRFNTILTYAITRIVDDDRISITRPYLTDWNLVIRNVQAHDAGKYECQINTKPVKYKTVSLYVGVPPSINVDLSSPDIITREGQTVPLTCNVTGIPLPVVHWYRRPLDQAIGKQKERIGTNGEVLIIHNITRYCGGIYECFAFNKFPPAVKKDIKVEVEFPPEIDLHTRRIGQSPGRETILECQITAFPMNLLVWRYNNQDLLTSTKHRVEVYNDGNHRVTLSLRVMDITYADYGNYTCFAQNKLGTDQDVMLLYDHRVHTKATTSTTTYNPPLLRTTVHQTIWLPNDGSRKSNDGNDKGALKEVAENKGICNSKHPSVFHITFMIILCFVT